MKILLLGAGGREHALAWKIRQSPLCGTLFVAPGNAGTAQIAQNVVLNPLDFAQVADFITQEGVEMLVVGPEEPLVRGLRDYLEAQPALRELIVVGAGAQGAQLEGSKDFAKEFMQRHHIPTAAYRSFSPDTLADGLEYLAQHTLPIVLKADGLAAGKGVLILDSVAEAQEMLREMLGGKFGAASAKVVVEEFLSGIEVSVFVLTDGQEYCLLPEAKDYKRVGVGDTGLNTGGMGAVSPVPFADAAFMQRVEAEVIAPTLRGLAAEGIAYQGFIFFGLIKVGSEPYVIEYNCRMGDPETEVVMPRIDSDIVEMFVAMAQGKLKDYRLNINPLTATTVMLVSGGYPEAYQKGKVIHIPDTTLSDTIFHAGTKINVLQEIVSDGGRVMACTAMDKDIPSALAQSNALAEMISFEGKYFRSDIGLDLLA